MRVVVVGGDSPHHRHLALKLSESHDVAGVIHPVVVPPSGIRRVKRFAGRVRREGAAPVARAIGRRLPGNGRWDTFSQTQAAEHTFFESDRKEFERTLSDRVLRLPSINSVGTIEKIKALKPDLIVSMGGAIYRKPFIEAFPLTINLHAGVSPVYNGTGTIYFAFADERLQFCGGTLMALSEKIDGGEILAHALPGVEPGDSPATLFMKTVREQATLTASLLSDMSNGINPVSVPQGRPFIYTRGRDHTPASERKVQQLIDEGAAAKSVRDARHIIYWREPDMDSARKLLESTIGELICRS
jgi:methionyl-tRNA formyltransferase